MKSSWPATHCRHYAAGVRLRRWKDRCKRTRRQNERPFSVLADLLDQIDQSPGAVDAAKTFQGGMIGLGNARFDLVDVAQITQAVDEFVEQSLGRRIVDRFEAKRGVVQKFLGLSRIQTLLRQEQSITGVGMLCCDPFKMMSRY
jgi:hypothetical protein